MAPENNNTGSPSANQATAQAAANAREIQITAPQQGVVQTVESQPGAQLQFEFDPSTANFERTGNDLVITPEGGGTVTLTDFFAVGDEPLPNFVLANGAVVAGVDFLQEFSDGMDLTTAAGPGGGAAGAGGSGDYSDDPGALVDGLDRLGSQGTLFWGRDTEPLLTAEGLTVGGGSFSFTVITPGSGEFDAIVGLYEDGHSHQHEGNFTDLAAGQIFINPVPGPESEVGAITISGLPADATLWLGDPASGSATQLAPVNGVYNLTLDQFTGLGVFILPGENNSDVDFPITVSVTFDGPGGSSTEYGTATVAVDAVADMPGESHAHTGETGVAQTDLDVDRQFFAEGKTHTHGEGATIHTGELRDLTVDVKVSFSDLDGSELHTIEVKGVPSDWTLNSTGLGAYSSVGDFADIDAARLALHDTPDSYATVTVDGVVTYIFNVGDTALVDSSLSFNPHDWTSARGADGSAHLGEGGEPVHVPADIEVTARAEEIHTGDLEPNTLNNVAEKTLGDWQVSIREDTPDMAGGICITSDESFGPQTMDEWRALIPNLGLLPVLGQLELLGDLPVSVATQTIFYDMHSDGANDGYFFDPSRNAGQANLAFAGEEGEATGWATTDGKETFWHFDAQTGTAMGMTEDGKVAFVVIPQGSLANGAHVGGVTFIQYESLRHPTGGESHDEWMKDSLKLKLVLTDDDGDTISRDVSVNVRDDGPCIIKLTPTIPCELDETLMEPLGLNLHAGGVIAYSFGADNEGAQIGWDPAKLPELSSGHDASGEDIPVRWYADEDGTIPVSLTDTGLRNIYGFADADGVHRPVIKLSLHDGNENGIAEYRYEQVGPLNHPVEGTSHSAHDDPLSFGFGIKVIDGDGDVAETAIRITVDDDGPTAGPMIGAVAEDYLRGHDSIQCNGPLLVYFGADNVDGKAVYWDQESISDELGDLKAIIDGQQIETKIIFDDPEHPTLVRIVTDDGNETPIAQLEMVQKADGTYEYKYDQYTTIAHGAHGTLEDLVKTLKFGFIVEDSDGDTASSAVSILVADGSVLPSVDGAHVDESYDMHKTHTFNLDHIDYNAPDDIVAVVWNEGLVAKALGEYHAANSDAALRVDVSADGKTLTVYDGDSDTVVFTATITGDVENGFQVQYVQDHALSHFIPGLAHDDPLPLLLTIDVVDGDGDRALNLFAITVDDDGPESIFASNVLMLQHVGQAMLEGLNDLDFQDPEAFVQSLTTVMGQVLNSAATIDGGLDLADLLLNTDLARFTQAGMTDLIQSLISGEEPDLSNLSLDLLNTLIKGVPGYVPFDINNPISYAQLGTLGRDLINEPLKILLGGQDIDRTEHEGAVYKGNFTPDFGVDGPAGENSQISGWNASPHADKTPNGVGWSPIGVQGMLHLMGVHATAHPDAMLMVEASGDTYPPDTLIISADGDKVMTLHLIDNHNGTYSYEVSQHMALEHDPGAIQQLLGQLGDGLLADGLPLDQLGLDPTMVALLEPLLQNLSPGALIEALGSGNLLTLPLPIVIMDGDGDIAPSMISLTIRDSVPQAITGASGMISETDVHHHPQHGDPGIGSHYAVHGTDYDRDHDNIGKDNITDEHIVSGKFSFTADSYGFDGANAKTPFFWEAPEAGKFQAWGTAGSDKPVDIIWIVNNEPEGATLTGIDALGHVVIKFVAVYGDSDNPAIPTGYQVIQHLSVVHADDAGYNDVKIPVTFGIMDGDGDVSKAVLELTIRDDVPLAVSETDSTRAVNTGTSCAPEYEWIARGNIITESGTDMRGEGRDQWGADGRRPDDGLKIWQPDHSTEDQNDGEWKPIAMNNPDATEIKGVYGTLFVRADGSYSYVLDPAKLADAQNIDPHYGKAYVPPTTTDLGGKDAALDLKGSGVNASAPGDGITFKGFSASTLPGSVPGDGNLWAGATAKNAVATANGIGVQGSPAGNEIGAREGLLIDLHGTAGEGGVSLTLTNLGGLIVSSEKATVAWYDVNGDLIADSTTELTGSLLSPSPTVTGPAGAAYAVVLGLNPSGWGATTSFTVSAIDGNIDRGDNWVNDPNWTPKEHFGYTLTDRDGDTAKATLTIDVKTGPQLIGKDSWLHVDEAYLPGRDTETAADTHLEPAGTRYHGDDDHPRLSDTGRVTFMAPEGVGSIEIAGVDVTFGADGKANLDPDSPILTGHGQITGATLTETLGPDGEHTGKFTLEYTYKLLDNHVDDADPAAQGRNWQDDADSFKIVITDKYDNNPEDPVTHADADKLVIDVDVDIRDDRPLAGGGKAIVFESDIEAKDGVNAGTDDGHDFANKPGDIYSPESYTDTDHGADQGKFSGSLHLNYGADGMAAKDAFAWNPPEDWDSLRAMVNGEWQEVEWAYGGANGDDKTILVGTADGVEVMRLTCTDTATGAYTVDLQAALKHDLPIDDAWEARHHDDQTWDRNFDLDGFGNRFATNLKFGYTITDGDGDVATGDLQVKVQDDVPMTSSPEPDLNPDLLSAPITIDFGTETGSNSLIRMEHTGKLNPTDQGLGIIGQGEGQTLEEDKQISFHPGQNGGEDRADVLTFSLLQGKEAASVTFSVTHLITGEHETGEIIFYNDGVKVGSALFNSNGEISLFDAAGNPNTDPDITGAKTAGTSNAFTFTVNGITFDKVDFTAVNNPNHLPDATSWDNSDYYLKSVTFGAAQELGGSLGEFGADGPAAADPAVFTTVPDAIESVWLDGKQGELSFELSADGKTITGQITIDGDTTDVFTLTVGDDGNYDYTPLHNFFMPNGYEGGPFEFGYELKDADDDRMPGSLTIGGQPLYDDVPVAGSGKACVSESDIQEMKLGNDVIINAGTDADHTHRDFRNGETELPPVDTRAPYPNEAHAEGTLVLNYGADGMAANTPFAWDIPGELGELKAMVNGEWQDVAWKYGSDGADKTTLIGYVLDESLGEDNASVTVLELHMDPETGAYTVDLHAGLRHDAPDANEFFDRNYDLRGFTPEEAPTKLGFSYTIEDGDGDQARGTLDVQVRDDILDAPDSTGDITWTTGTETPPDIFFNHGDVIDLTSSGTDLSTIDGLTFSVKLATIVQGSITLADDPEAGAASIYRGDNGMGVHGSSIDPGGGDEHVRFREINYDKATNTSEALVIDLGGKLAFGLELGMGKFYANDSESSEWGRMTFYRDGEEVGRHDFRSVDDTGDADVSFNAIPGGFDKVVITALDNGGAAGGDNSDFYIKSLKFDTIEEEIIHYEQGTAGDVAEAVGADGVLPGSIRFQDGQSVVHTDQGDITVTVDPTSSGARLVGMLDGQKVFEAFLTPSTGKWDYFQYKNFVVTDSDNDGNPDPIRLGFQVQDNDGDYASANIVVENPLLPPHIEPTLTGADSTVYEGHLPTGSYHDVAHVGHDTQATLKYAVDLKGGDLLSFTVGTEKFTWDGDTNTLSGDPSKIIVDNGEVTGVSYDEASGVLTVTYQLTSALTDSAKHDAQGGEPADIAEGAVKIPVSVTSTGGSSASVNGLVDIVDDASDPNDDTVYVNGLAPSVSGNVIDGTYGSNGISGDADEKGADGAKVSQVFDPSAGTGGQWVNLSQGDSADPHGKHAVVDGGKLTIYEDGHYEFKGGTETKTIFDASLYPNYSGKHVVDGSVYTALQGFTITAVHVSGDGNNISLDNDGSYKFQVPGSRNYISVHQGGDHKDGFEHDRITEGVEIKSAAGVDSFTVRLLTGHSNTDVAFTGAETAKWVAYGMDGTVWSGTVSLSNLVNGAFTINPDGSEVIGRIVIYPGPNSIFAIASISVQEIVPFDEAHYQYKLTDGDGDISDAAKLDILGQQPASLAAMSGLFPDQHDAANAGLLASTAALLGHEQLVDAAALGALAGLESISGWDNGQSYILDHQADLAGVGGSHEGHSFLVGGDGNDFLVSGSLHYDGHVGQDALDALSLAAGDLSAAKAGAYLAEHLDLLAHGTEADGHNLLVGGAGNDLLIGGGGNDTIHGGDGNDHIFGGGGHDTLHGGAGDDTIHAGSGGSLIYGGQGNDVMHGGAGKDIFAWSGDHYDHGTDVVKSFNLEHGDALRFEDLVSGPQENLLGHLKGVLAGDHLHVEVHGADNTVIQNVDVHFEGSIGNYHSFQSFADAYNNANEATQADMMKDLLTKITTG